MRSYALNLDMKLPISLFFRISIHSALVAWIELRSRWLCYHVTNKRKSEMNKNEFVPLQSFDYFVSTYGEMCVFFNCSWKLKWKEEKTGRFSPTLHFLSKQIRAGRIAQQQLSVEKSAGFFFFIMRWPSKRKHLFYKKSNITCWIHWKDKHIEIRPFHIPRRCTRVYSHNRPNSMHGI